MRLRTILPFAALLAAGPSQAIDLTGTWEGQWKCSAFDGEKFKPASGKGDTLLVSQEGNEVAIGGDGSPFSGVVVPDDGKPDSKGELAASNCDTDADPTGGSDEIARLRVKADADSGKGSMKGTSVYIEGGNATGTCKWSYKRTSTADPGIAVCP